MSHRTLPVAAILSLGLACGAPRPAPAPPSDPVATMRTRDLAWSDHARCRMACRHIDEVEVHEALAHGTLDPDRSREEPGRCPTHALHHRSRDGQDLRVVFAACEDETVVVTAIDLGRDWPCPDC